jgi:uncharacterized membrane protein
MMYSIWALASVAAFVASICVMASMPVGPDSVTWYNFVGALWSLMTLMAAFASLIFCFLYEADRRQRDSSEMEVRYMKALRGE